jgi:hypothetical protein
VFPPPSVVQADELPIVIGAAVSSPPATHSRIGVGWGGGCKVRPGD